MNNKKTLIIGSVLLLPLALSGCLAAAAGGAAGTGYTIAQERSIGEIVDDNKIYSQIKTLYIQKDVNSLFGDVNVQVHEGRVLLTGKVEEPQTRVEAVRLAWQPSGVKEVINEVVVDNTSGFKDYAKDVWISSQVRARLVLEKNVHLINYTVDTVSGVVYLIGVAQDQKEIDKATLVASRVKGVKRVVSHLRVKDDPLRN